MWRFLSWRVGNRECRQAGDRLSAYIDDRLGAQERREVEQHLESCRRCAGELETLQATVQMLHRVPQEVPRCSFAIAESEARPVPRWSPVPLLRAGMAAAAACLVIVFAVDMVDLVETRSLSSQDSGTLSAGESTGEADSYGFEGDDVRAGEGETGDNQGTLDGEDDGEIVMQEARWVRSLEYGLLGLVVVLGGVTLAVRRRGGGLRSVQ